MQNSLPHTPSGVVYMDFNGIAGFIWSVADLLRGDYKQSDYGKVILPFTLLRRLDCVLEPTKAAVLAEHQARKDSKLPLDHVPAAQIRADLLQHLGTGFAPHAADPDNVRADLMAYIAGFSENARDIFERYDFQAQIDELDSAHLLYLIVQKFASVDLHPSVVDDHKMGLIFEELIRRFAELSNETAGEHFTPREVIRLMVPALCSRPDALAVPGIVRSLYDPTAGTGGMLSIGDEYLRDA